VEPIITVVAEKKLIGKKVAMSVVENKTPDLWRSFLPFQKAINHRVSNELISMSVYPEPVKLGDLGQIFDKWAAVEVSDYGAVPPDMLSFHLAGGLYAVFHYKGLSTDNRIFAYIYGTWLPNSIYNLDDRPSFEVLGDKYKNGDPHSEEDIYIPIKPKY